MSRRKHRDDEPTLFDLPLQGPEDAAPDLDPDEAEAQDRAYARSPSQSRADAPSPEDSREQAQPSRPSPSDAEPAEGTLFPDDPSEPAPPSTAPPPGPTAEPSAPFHPPDRTIPPAAPAPAAPAGERPAPVSVRYLAGLADLAIHLALAVVLLFGARLLGVRAGFEDWLPILLFLVVFSFFYSVLPLAFWGQTPGMAWAGLEARAADGGSLTFPQTALRWLGAVLSVVLLGLPTLLAVGGGRSLADRLSDSDCALLE